MPARFTFYSKTYALSTIGVGVGSVCVCGGGGGGPQGTCPVLYILAI